MKRRDYGKKRKITARESEVQTKEKARAGWGLLLSPPREKLPVWA
jgi:hypothetical protein